MSRRPDRKKHGKENTVVASSKDVSDAGTLRSSDIDVQPRSGQTGQRFTEPPHASLLQSRENSAQLQLLSETSSSNETKQPECKSSIFLMLESLKGRIDIMMQKSGMADSMNNESLELQSEMKKLLEATVQQKNDFVQLCETVRRQKDMLLKLEAMAKTGSLGQPIASAVISNEVVPVQCSHDLETRADLDATVVFLIGGRYEYRRKLSQSSDQLINVYIPDSVNLGSRMLPGSRQSFPNSLLQSLTFDASGNSPTVLGNSPTVLGNFQTVLMSRRPRTNGVGSELVASDFGAVGGVKELPVGSGRSCPMCALVFPMTETMDVFERHVAKHFAEEVLPF